MFYWLFTGGRALLSGLLFPLTCLSLLTPVLLSLWFGVGIQRRAEGSPFEAHGLQTLGRLLTFLIINLWLIAVYTNLLGNVAIARSTSRTMLPKGFLSDFVGGTATTNQQRLLLIGLFLFSLLFLLNIGLWQALRNGGWLRERIDRLRRPNSKRGEMGSAHLCTWREYRRYRRQDSEGVTLLGAFWGHNHQRLDLGFGKFCLSAEDSARGILALGGPGAGKTQGVILPAIADRMMEGYSLIVADPQGELTEYIRQFAKVTHHLVVVHDPTSLTGPRYNLAQGIANVSDAKSIANVLIPSMDGDNRFWTDSAADLLSACLIRFDNLGQIKSSLEDLSTLASRFSQVKDDATLLANAFIASVSSDGRVASNVVALLGTVLTGWASADVRANTNTSDFDADLIISRPTIVVLTCPGRMRSVYASYLGAVLRKLMLDLDTIGERNHGPLPMPVGIVLDEFPTLGKLDSLVADVNLVRKRRISILIGAQTKGQFHLIYGNEGTQALFTGLATQIVYGGCDHDTADFYSKASGTSTADANPDPQKANYRQRPLLTVDEIVNPQDGNCTVFARFVEPSYAAQVILTARLTRLYEREDWKERLAQVEADAPLELERGPAIDVSENPPPTVAPDWERHAAEQMSAAERRLQSNTLAQAGVRTVTPDQARQRLIEH